MSSSLDTLFASCDNGQRPPSPDSLLNALHGLLQEFPHAYIILDALDECGSRKRLMAILKKLSMGQMSGLHLLCTSRREGDIEATLGRILDSRNVLCIPTDAVDHDIESYVRQRLSDDDGLQKWRDDGIIRQKIESALLSGAHGMFRWAACQLDSLETCRNKKQLVKALESLPADLDETYNRILLSIRRDDIIYAIQILRWLVFSPRPLLLTEVAEIAALDADRYPAFDRDEVLEDPLDVLSICSSLVTVADTNNATNDGSEYVLGGRVIILAHYSVKEYLISERICGSQAASFYLKPLLCHQTIAKCCLHYLLQFEGSDALTEE
ncbi:hypothetical protein DL95DRAFT_311039, partial [Leptodontidium sp. 2 PMI_412]